MAKAKTIAVFDLDRTLTRAPTFSAYLWMVARDEPNKVLYVFAVLIQMALYLLKLKSRTRLKEYMLSAFMKGMSKREVAKHTEKFLEKLFDGGFHLEGLRKLEEHRKKGHLVGIATASMDFYAGDIAKRLKCDFVIASTSVWEKSCLVPLIKGGNCYGEEKARRLKAFIEKTKPNEVWFYSDSSADLPAFELADVKIAVNPSWKLKAAAQKAGLKIERWG